MQNVKQLKVFGFRNVTAIKIQCRFARRFALIAAATILAAIQEGLDCAPNLFCLLFVCFHRQILARKLRRCKCYFRNPPLWATPEGAAESVETSDTP